MASPAGPQGSPKRVLVVEDEVMIRMLLEDMLTDLGYEIAGTAGGLDEALKLACNTPVDVAILDVNLSGNPVYPVADALTQRRVPFIFSTGYGEHGLPEAYRDCPLLQKPFQMENLEQALARLAGGGA